VRAGNAAVGDYLDLVAAVRDDPNANVLAIAFAGVAPVRDRIASNNAEKEALSAWVRQTFGPAYAKLPPPSVTDSPAVRELRGELFTILGNYGKDPAVVAEAAKIARQYLADPSSVDATLGQRALSIAAANGDSALFDQLQKVYESSIDPEIQEGALHRLAQFEDPTLATRALDYAVTKVRNQDAASQFASALNNNATREVAWKYIQANWQKVLSQLTASSGSRLVSATGSFCTAEDRDQVKSYFAAHPVPSSDRSLKHALEHIDGCIELRSLQGPKLQQWLAAQAK
jgi:aminopeptidase N/puromycin-sensitive aminopeptidase